LRVAASYAVIAWLVLQIADVVLEPSAVPRLPETFRRHGLARPPEIAVP